MFRNKLLTVFGPDVLKAMSLSRHRGFHQNYNKNNLLRGDFFESKQN